MTEDQGRWQVSVHGRNLPPHASQDQTEEWLHTQRILREAGYRGPTYHHTQDEAEAAAKTIMAEVVNLDPSIEWMSIWCMLYNNGLPRDKNQGACFWNTHEPQPKA